MKAYSTLPDRRRDLRLDLFRGLANWLIFLGHIPGSLLAWFTTRNYGFSDGADLFVFISGYTASLVYARMMVERGFIIGATRLWKRAWQLYVAQLLLFVLYVGSVHYVAHRFDIPHLMDQFNVAGLMDDPVDTLVQGMLLRYKPLNLDVLPLYIVLMTPFPMVLWLLIRWPSAVMAGSGVLYLAARYFHWNLSAYPEGVWYFDPFVWQLLFILGGWLALGGADRLRGLARSRLALALSVSFLIFAFAMTLSSAVPAFQSLFAAGLRAFFVPNDKTYLAPYRVVHLAALVVVVVHFIPRDWPGLTSAALQPLIKCGQQSLEVFCVGVFLSFVAHVVLITVSDSIPAQLGVGGGGLLIMVAVAYYRGWSRQVDQPLPRAAAQLDRQRS